MQRFTEELNNLTTQARVLEIDIQRAKLLTEERTTIPEDGSMMRRRLSRVTKCSNTLQDSLKATARAEAGIIEILNILATDEQETIANALKAEKERLQLDQLAISGSTAVFTLQTLAKEINDKIEFYSSDDDSSIIGNNIRTTAQPTIRTEQSVTSNVHEEIRILRQQMTDITMCLKQLQRANCDPNPVQSPSSRMNQPTSPIQPLSAQIKRPQLTLPSFDGDAANFNSYWTAFSTVIDGDTSLSLREKALYLGESLKGRARDHIRGIVLNEYSYDTIVQTLQQSYKSHIPEKWRVFTELTKLLPSGHTAAEAQEQVRKIRCLLDQLSMAGIYYSNEVAWITTIINQFPQNIAEKLFQETDANRDIGTVMTEIEKQVTALAQLEAYKVHRYMKPALRGQEDKRRKDFAYHRDNIPHNNVKGLPQHTSPTCFLCDRTGHKSYQCRTVSSVEDRRKIVKDKKLCWKCFTNKHTSNECKMSNCPQCGANHHGSLCVKKPKEGFRPKDTMASITQERKKHTVLMIAEVNVILDEEQNKTTVLNAFFDTGATSSFISQESADKLRLKNMSPKRTIKTGGFANNKSEFASYQVEVNMRNQYGEVFQFILNTAPALTQPLRSASLTQNDINFIAQQNVQLSTSKIRGECIKPDIIIGMDYYHYVVYGAHHELPSGLHLQSTAFGMAICGSTPESDTFEEMISTIIEDTEKEERRMIKQLFEIDSIGIDTTQGTLEKADEFFNQYASSISFDDGVVTAPLPLKPNHQELKNNYRVAGRTLYTLFNSFDKKPEQLIWYKKIIKEYVRQGIVEIAPPRTPGEINYFMPHRGVWKENKATPLRIVFNCSAKAKGEQSLNDVLYTGDSYINKIFDILIVCRLKPIFLVCDIQGAFTQIRLRQDHKRFCQFLWLKDDNKPPSPQNILVYQFTRIVFGMTTSPSILNVTLTTFLRQQEEPIAQEMIKNLYVDNIMMTADTKEEAIRKYTVSKQMLKRIDMNLREYQSNNEEVNLEIPEVDRYPNKTVKILGATYNMSSDSFTSKFTWEMKESYTKRDLLSLLHSVYDPLGFLAPLLLPFKLLLREVFEMKLDWKDTTPESIAERWNKLSNSIRDSKVDVERSVNMQEDSILWIFSDASFTATATCAYVQTGNRISQILTGKAKLAPRNRKLTIPRLELIALVMASRLAESIHSVTNQQLKEIRILSDSQIALSWIRSQKTLPIFVDNQCTLIRKTIKKLKSTGTDIQLFYVETKHNPADIGSRGWTENNLLQASQWIQGPQWTMNATEHQPIIPYEQLVVDREEEITVNTITEVETLIVTDPFPTLSSLPLNKALRIVTRILRWRKRTERFMSPVSGLDIKKSLNRIIIAHQMQLTDDVMERTMKGSSSFFDEDGIRRVRSRITSIEIEFDVRNPIIIPRKSDLMKQLIRHAHETNCHCGVEHTLAIIRLKYFTTSARQLVKSVINDCWKCRKLSAKPFRTEPLGPLPGDRTKARRVFQHTGVDALGPIKYHREQKVYIILSTCLAVRAVHLELVDDLSGEAFILAFSRFISRRGVPEIMRSDNGGNFIMTEHMIQKLHEPTKVEGKTLFSYVASKGITWIFNTPGAPWTGGAWERLVRTVKSTLQKGLKARRLTKIQLVTVMCKAEAVINSRPLTYASDDQYPIRPIDFISPKAPLEVFNSEYLDENDPTFDPEERENRKKVILTMSKLERVLEQFWKRFQQEYLANLRNLFGHPSKNKNNPENPQVGDIVLIKEEDVSKGEWRMGRITELLPSADKVVRSVRVLSSNGFISTKPTRILYPTELRAYQGSDNIEDETPVGNEENESDVESMNNDVNMRNNNTGNNSPRDDTPLVTVPDEPVQQRKKTDSTTRVDSTTPQVEERQKGKGNQEPVKVSEPKWTPVPRPISPFRPSSRRRLPWKHIYTIISLLALTVSTVTTTVICESGILNIDENHGEAELCLYEKCRNIAAKTRYSISLPPHPHMERHPVMYTESGNTRRIDCHGTDVCQHATWFSRYLIGNPHCSVIKAIITVLAPIILVLLIAGALFKFLTRERRQPVRGYIPSRLQTMILTLMVLNTVQGYECTDTLSRHQMDYVCTSNQCNTSFTRELLFNTAVRQACIETTHSGHKIRETQIDLVKTKFICHKKSMFFTRHTRIDMPYQVSCPATKRCGVFNGCANMDNISEESVFWDTDKYPGRSHCEEIPGGILKGCFFTAPACLIFRPSFIPTDDAVYEVFTCSTWTPTIVVRIKEKVDGRVVNQTNVEITPYTKIEHNHLSIAVEQITYRATRKYLGERFVTNSKLTALLLPTTSFNIMCESSDQAKNRFGSCNVTQPCSCAASSVPPKCSCPGINIERTFYYNSLPIKSGNSEIDHRDTTVEISSNEEEVNVFITGKEMEDTMMLKDNNKCEISEVKAIGCYDCEHGMSVQLKCKSTEKMTIAVKCETQVTTIQCDSHSPKSKKIIYAREPETRMECTAFCEEKTKFWINASLIYMPEHVGQLTDAKPRKQKEQRWSLGTFDMELPNFGPIFGSLWNHWRVTVITVVVSILAIIIIIQLAPLLIIIIGNLLSYLIKVLNP